MKNIFTEHPHSVGETYLEHGKFACLFGINMVIGGLACLIHAIFPFLFEKTGSKILMNMMSFYVKRMPTVDGRVLEICKKVDEKQQNFGMTETI